MSENPISGVAWKHGVRRAESANYAYYGLGGAGVMKKQRTYGEGRVCNHPGCGTIISCYRPGSRCQQHTKRRLKGEPK
jgi:hypothetical protein